MVPKDKRGFAAVLAVFLAAAAASGLLKGVYLFGWMVHPKSIGIFGQYFRVRGFPFWVLGAAALVLLAFGRKYAAYSITLGNIAGLLAGYVLGERHEAAILAKITPDMDEGTAGAMLCGANDGVFIWLEILLLFFAVGLAMADAEAGRGKHLTGWGIRSFRNMPAAFTAGCGCPGSIPEMF